MKRFIGAVVLLFALMASFQCYAAGGTITYEQAKVQMVKNNRSLNKLRYTTTTYRAQIQYENIMKSNEDLSIDSIKRFYSLMGRKLDPYDEMQLLKQRDYTPSYLKYLWESAQKNESTQNALRTIQLRQAFLSCFSANQSIAIKKLRVEIYTKENDQNKVKQKKGLISKIDLEESQQRLLAVEMELAAAVRNRETAVKSLNLLLGAPLKTEYGSFIFSEAIKEDLLLPEEEYVVKALENRKELWDFQKQIELKQLEMKVMEVNRVNEIYYQTRIDYGDLVNSAQALKLKLEQEKARIELEIRTSYLDIKKAKQNLEKTLKKVKLQENALAIASAKVQSGVKNTTMIEALKIDLKEAKNAYALAGYEYNTKILELEVALGSGSKNQRGAE